jgi:hypothetical protein
MNEQSSIQQGANISSTQDANTGTQGVTTGNATSKSLPESTEVAATEHRQAYGTAKTENLRDSGLWRIILPAFVALVCIALLAVPLIILIPLFVRSLDATAPTHSLSWLWIVMIILELGVAVVIARGLIKIFMTQAGNYPS